MRDSTRLEQGTAAAGWRWLIGITWIVALGLGAAAALVTADLDYTLAYHDARARLVVARRVFDSPTPGLEQLGGIWLPLPHLLNVPLVQVDHLYRTGLGTVALNVVAFATLVAATVRIAGALTGRRSVALLAGGAMALHPDLLYLQATPMTEPLAIGLLSGAIALLLALPGSAPRPWMAAVLLALAMLTRYEPWLAGLAVLAVTAIVPHAAPALLSSWRRHHAVPILVMGAAAVAVAAGWSWAMTGEWINTSGFFTPSNLAGRPAFALGEVLRVSGIAVGPGLVILAAVGVAVVVQRGRRDHATYALLLAAAPLAPILLFWYAADAGHPVLQRFGVFVVVPAIWLAAAGVAGLDERRSRRTLAFLLAVSVGWHAALWTRPPTIREARTDVREREGTADVLRSFRDVGGTDRVLASMWSGASVLHGLSAYDVPLRHVVHEGTGPAWFEAVTRPAPEVEWILVVCRAGEADRVFRSLTARPGALGAYEIAARGGGLEVYRRRSGPRTGPAPLQPCLQP